jgi:crotonobetainyl-CoA:carnitine CoA-transferase CaiB-like acyl-CoA transferase
LKNIRVVELGTYITGPAAALHLADLGADVIKVERPGSGDPFPRFQGRALFSALPDLQPQQAIHRA